MILSSFDIFDTTLIRWCGKPENVFVLLAKRLFPHDRIKQNDFILWRNYITQTFKGEYNISDIYHITNGNSLFGFSSEELIKAEECLEAELLIVNEEIKRKIMECRKAGHKIAFISDMYLSCVFLRDILIKEGVFEEGDGLYVSNDRKARKDTGELYDIVQKDYSPQKWFHYGDNKYSDHIIAQKKGIKSVLINIDYNEVETKLQGLSSLMKNPLELSILSGISRVGRRKFGNTNDTLIASNFVAATYIPYILSVLKDAKSKGLKTLYFVSRDGYILHEIAKCLPHDNIILKYLFVSRKSLHSPFFYVATDEELKESNLRREQSKEVYKEDYELCYGYLLQEGLFDDYIGLVDVGWRGTSRLMINSIRRANGKGQLMSYYLGQGLRMLPNRFGKYDVFDYTMNTNGWKTLVLEEYYSASPWPTTIGYQKRKGIFTPIFPDSEKYKEDDIVSVNKNVCCWMASIIGLLDLHQESLYFWMTSTQKILFEDGFYVDWGKLYEKYKEKEFCIERFSIKETINYIRAQYVSFRVNCDVSLDLTYGYKIRKRINKLRYIYLLIRKYKYSVLYRLTHIVAVVIIILKCDMVTLLSQNIC